MKKSVDFESVLSLIDRAINPMYLNPTQEIVLREVWQGKTYSEMACAHNYDPEYIKSVGCNLWQTLSKAFDNQINKGNFVPFMRQHAVNLLDFQETEVRQLSRSLLEEKKENFCCWTTAPETKNFVGREQEIEQLEAWSQEANCRCIIVSGMVGCGKTTLATKFGKLFQNRFKKAIWLSLHHTSSLKTLLITYLSLINGQPSSQQDYRSADLGFLLSRFIDCLKKERILLIVDGLQSVLRVNTTSITYRQECEEYGQFLRSIITTEHQSLLIATSRLKPKMLEYYMKDRVKFLNLQGFPVATTRKFFQARNSGDNIAGEETTSLLTNTFQGNPQLLTVISNYLDSFSFGENYQQKIHEFLLDEIIDLIELELSYLSELEKEIVYWLVISCGGASPEDFAFYIQYPLSRIEFCLDALVKRSLVLKKDDTYSLMPIVEVYLKRKFVRQALANNN